MALLGPGATQTGWPETHHRRTNQWSITKQKSHHKDTELRVKKKKYISPRQNTYAFGCVHRTLARWAVFDLVGSRVKKMTVTVLITVFITATAGGRGLRVTCWQDRVTMVNKVLVAMESLCWINRSAKWVKPLQRRPPPHHQSTWCVYVCLACSFCCFALNTFSWLVHFKNDT